ncbi:MAG: acyltransferase family protein [Clostridia bacterium]|nr:acyltransferase family protein [Clostridia bacterium]
MSSVKTRDVKWDNVKFVLIFLVVLGHIADIYADISVATGILRFVIYTFHMPLFIFISGLFGKTNIRERRWNKIFSYLVLYLFIKVIDFAAKWVVNGTKPAFHLFSDGSVPWYAFCLFAFSVITIAAERFDRKYVFVFSLILAVIAGYDNEIRDFLCLSRIIVYFPFYYAGYCLEADKVKEKLSGKKSKIAGTVIIAVTVAVTIIFYDQIKDVKFLFTGRNPYGIFRPGCPYAFLVRIVCYIVSTFMGAAVIALVPGGEKRTVFSDIGAKSVQIYALHFFFKILYFGLLNNTFRIDSHFTSILLVYEIIIAVVLTAICALPFWNGLFSRLMNVPLRLPERKE